jgi:hypothetical protein
MLSSKLCVRLFKYVRVHKSCFGHFDGGSGRKADKEDAVAQHIENQQVISVIQRSFWPAEHN